MSTIITRLAKGSALSHEELDANFTNLNTDKIEDITTSNLNDLIDLNAPTPTDGQSLTWDSATSKWIASTVSGGGGGGAATGGNLFDNFTLDYDMNAGDVVHISGDGTVGKVGNQIPVPSDNPGRGDATGGDPPLDSFGSQIYFSGSRIATKGDLIAFGHQGKMTMFGLNADGTVWGISTQGDVYDPNLEAAALRGLHIGDASHIFSINKLNGWSNTVGTGWYPTARVQKVPYSDNGWTGDDSGHYTLANVEAAGISAYTDPVSLRFMAIYNDKNSNAVYISYGKFTQNSMTPTFGPALEVKNSGLLPSIQSHGDHIQPILTSNGSWFILYNHQSSGQIRLQRLSNDDNNWTVSVDAGDQTALPYQKDILSVVPDPHNPDHFVMVNGRDQEYPQTFCSYFSVINDTYNSTGGTPLSQSHAVGGTSKGTVYFDPNDNTKIFVMGKDRTTMGQGHRVAFSLTIDRVTNTITKTGETVFSELGSSYNTDWTYVEAHNGMILATESMENQNYPTVRHYTHSSTTTTSNINDVTPYGILQETGLLGETKQVNLLGSYSDVHSALTVDADYSVAQDGTLVLSTDGSAVHSIGKAITSTGILQIDAGDQGRGGGSTFTDAVTIDGADPSTTITESDPHLNIRINDYPNHPLEHKATIFKAYRDHNNTWNLNNPNMNPSLELWMQSNAINDYNNNDWGWGGRNNVGLTHTVVGNDQQGDTVYSYNIMEVDPGYANPNDQAFIGGRIIFPLPMISMPSSYTGWSDGNNNAYWNLLIDNEYTPGLYTLNFAPWNSPPGGDFTMPLCDGTYNTWIDNGPFRPDKLGFSSYQEFQFIMKLDMAWPNATTTITNMFPDAHTNTTVSNVNTPPSWVDLANNRVVLPTPVGNHSVYVIKYRTIGDLIFREFEALGV